MTVSCSSRLVSRTPVIALLAALDAALTVTAVDGMATVVQDEHGNTYQLSQQ